MFIFKSHRYHRTTSSSSHGSPFTPSTATFAQPPRENTDVLPGFLKYSHLINQARSTGANDLPLPDKYKVLEKISQALDHTLVFLKGQNQQCVFHKIKKSVENMSRRWDWNILRYVSDILLLDLWYVKFISQSLTRLLHARLFAQNFRDKASCTD